MDHLGHCVGRARRRHLGVRMITKREALNIRQAVRELVSAEIAFENRVIVHGVKSAQARELRIAKARLTAVLDKLTEKERRIKKSDPAPIPTDF